jgi:hypothetical protein
MTDTPKAKYHDEQFLVDKMNGPPRFILASEIDMSEDRQPGVMPHNTMRFDVHMASVYAIFDNGETTKEDVAKIISDAIVQAVNKALGPGLDGRPIPGGLSRYVHKHSVMLHREMLSCDLS